MLLESEIVAQSSGEGARTSAFRPFLQALLSNWWVIATCGLVVCVGALGLSLLSVPQYRSTATLYVTAGSDDGTQSAYQGSLASQQRVESYSQLVKSGVLIEKALAETGLGVSLATARDSIETASANDTVLLQISVTLPSPDEAALLANALSAELAENVMTLEQPAGGGTALAKVTLVAPARPEASPVSPKVLRNSVLGFVVGALVALVYLYMRFKADGRVRSAEQAEAASGAPLLSSIPDEPSLAEGSVVDFRSGASMAAEAYRKLRTNLTFVNIDNKTRCVMVTSANPSDGKTTTALNLAASLAEAGNNVLVVDADLRSPSVAPMLGLSGDVGLTDLLRTDIAPSELIQQTEFDGLSVLCSGPRPPNSTELLGSQRSRQVFSQIREAFDFVIVDSPPVLPLADANVVSQIVDGVLVVVRDRSTKTAQVVQAVSELRAVDATLLGTVLNRSDSSVGLYSYSAYGAYGSGS